MSRGQRIGLLALALAVAVVAVVIAASGGDDDEAPKTATTARTESKPAPPAVTHIRVRNGAATTAVLIAAEKGDVLRLRVTSDAEHEVHVHGYDIFRTAAPGRPARFRFEADIEGVFEIELEDTHKQIARLTVRPS